jgi:hypothetical protein
MKKFVYFSLVFSLILAIGYGTVFAASSGNFAADIATAACMINNTDGTLSSGLTSTALSTTIQTPNSSSIALVMRPSLVTGLFTRTKVDSSVSDFTAIAGVQVRVLLDGKVVAPGTPVGELAGPNDGWVYYDQRFQRLSTNLFNALEVSACDDDTTVEVELCEIDLVLSTLSAHSIDFVAGDVGGGEHTVEVQWRLDPTSPNANEAACVGPGVFTVQQVKTFSTGGGIDINPDNN